MAFGDAGISTKSSLLDITGSNQLSTVNSFLAPGKVPACSPRLSGQPDRLSDLAAVHAMMATGPRHQMPSGVCVFFEDNGPNDEEQGRPEGYRAAGDLGWQTWAR